MVIHHKGRVVKNIKTLGIIGGLGPMATAYFMQLMICMTKAYKDRDHIPMMVYNNPRIPDRTAYILDKSRENPKPYLIGSGRLLEESGVQVLALTCITAHYFYEELVKEFMIPLFDMREETARWLKKEGHQKVGLLATLGTIKGDVFKGKMEEYGIELVTPSERSQQAVMHMIYDEIKAGKEVSFDLFRQVEDELRGKGVQAVILGCTELSLIKNRYKLGSFYVDALEVLAAALIPYCGGKLKEEYEIQEAVLL